MYRPQAFDIADTEELQGLVRSIAAAHLVTAGGVRGPMATFMPMLLDTSAGAKGALLGHMARPNPHWEAIPEGSSALAIFAGLDGYVSPSFYPSKREHGKVVPTWNYVVVQVRGELHVHDDPEWVADFVRRLTVEHEQHRAEPWSVDDAPTDYFAAMCRQIVGIEMRITETAGSRKFSQNRPDADIAGVIAGLAEGTCVERVLAGLMDETVRGVPT
jgi:transcriptional regulator